MVQGQSYSEIEVKLFVRDLTQITKQLEASGAICSIPRVYERNLRYENAANTLSEAGVVLRLRQDNNVRLTYKDAQNPEAAERGIQQRFEAEVQVSDAEAMDTILRRLGFQPYMVYEKYRTTYLLDQAEIVLDEMPYGNFIEIEANEEGIISNLIERLNLTEYPKIFYSYAVLFDRIKEKLNLSFHDLTFQNFQDVTIPIELIIER